MRFAYLLLLAGCVADFAFEEPSEPDVTPPEVDGSYADPHNGFCVGAVSPPGWARCTRCDHEEAACLTTAGCRAVYADDLRTPAAERLFRDCFPIAAGGDPVTACAALDAIACSQRDDCTALHAGLFPSNTPFVACSDELAN